MASSAAAAQSDLLQRTDQKVVHFVVEYRRHFHVFAAVALRQRLAVCNHVTAVSDHRLKLSSFSLQTQFTVLILVFDEYDDI